MELLQKIILRLGWGTITVFAIILFYTTAFYFSFRSDIHFLKEKQDVVFNVFWRTAFYIHITGGMLAIVLGPFQFLRQFRNRNFKVHRLMGKIYLAAILFLAGPTGLFMAFYAEGGFGGAAGFTVMALLWIFTTWKAYESIMARKIDAHRNWMVRSYALTFAAVTLRLWVPWASHYLGISPEITVISSAWISWIPNLIVAEILIRTIPKKM
jgi:uncharacterized membrane protein